MREKLFVPILWLGLSCFAAPGSKVTFDEAGNTRINGKSFFPIGVFSYSPDTAALEDMRRHGFNAIVAVTEHHQPQHLDLMFGYGLRVICPVGGQWLEPATNHPGMLAWYLADEPEGHGQSPESLREKYLEWKQKDRNHPIGLDHFLLDSLPQYKAAADFTMTSYYPVLATNAPPLENSAVFLERSRAIHGKSWPHWPFIQIFGGPNTDGGRWRQPLPAEVRCLVYIALVHRAQGVFYFSYWPQAKKTWAEVGVLNREIQRLTPWLVATGSEISASSTNRAVHVRAKQLAEPGAGLLLGVNTSASSVRTEISIPAWGKVKLRGFFDGQERAVTQGKIEASFGPHESRAWAWGDAPKIEWAEPGGK